MNMNYYCARASHFMGGKMQDMPRRKFLASCMALSALPLPVVALPRDIEAFALLKQRSRKQLVGRVHILPATPDTTQW